MRSVRWRPAGRSRSFEIDLLAGGDEESGEVHLELEDTAGASGLDLTTPVSAGVDSRESSDTGISVFDTDHGSEEDAEATQVSEAFEEELSLDEVGSGSGLLDLTRESDDTSLGAELLEEVYSGEENIEIPANASGLFEAASGEMSAIDEAAAASGITSMPMVVEVYDGAGSGLGTGLMLGALVALICVAIIAVVGVTGATPDLAIRFAGNLWMWFGGLLVIAIVFGLIGLFIGKSTE